MKLFETIITYDVYVAAESHDAAREAALAFIRDQNEPLPPSEQVAIEARDKKNVRTAWLEERPLVGNDVSDEDFEKLKGKTTIQVYEMLYTKQQTLPGTK